MKYEAFHVEIEDKVAHVVLNRPQALNALCSAFWPECREIFSDLSAATEVRAVVLTSTGKHFSAGMDFSFFDDLTAPVDGDPARLNEQRRRLILNLQESFNAIERCSVPVLAGVQGAAIGGAVLGMLLTLLILAIINGGTLNFTGGSNVADLEAHLARIDENVGAVSTNVDIVAEQALALQGELASVESSLNTALASQGEELDTINEALVGLAATRMRVDYFLSALSEAMAAMEDLDVESGVASE